MKAPDAAHRISATRPVRPAQGAADALWWRVARHLEDLAVVAARAHQRAQLATRLSQVNKLRPEHDEAMINVPRDRKTHQDSAGAFER